MDQAEKMRRFEAWWWDLGSGLTPRSDHDAEQHAHRVARDAWLAAMVVADQAVGAERFADAELARLRALLDSWVSAHEDGQDVTLEVYERSVRALPAGGRRRLRVVT